MTAKFRGNDCAVAAFVILPACKYVLLWEGVIFDNGPFFVGLLHVPFLLLGWFA